MWYHTCPIWYHLGHMVPYRPYTGPSRPYMVPYTTYTYITYMIPYRPYMVPARSYTVPYTDYMVPRPYMVPYQSEGGERIIESLRVVVGGWPTTNSCCCCCCRCRCCRCRCCRYRRSPFCRWHCWMLLFLNKYYCWTPWLSSPTVAAVLLILFQLLLIFCWEVGRARSWGVVVVVVVARSFYT